MRVLCTIAFCLLIVAGCSNQDTNKTREEASKITSEFKQATRDASKEIKKGAEEARKQGSAVAEGVREGWNSDQKAVNVNSASTSQLMNLPGIDAQSAHRIISNRPYRAKEDLAKRGIVGEDEYHRIEDKIVVN